MERRERRGLGWVVDIEGPRERQGCRPNRYKWGSRLLEESGEILGTVHWLRESGSSGASVKPLLHTGPERELALAFPLEGA